jgi:hypothetical protein
MGHAGCRTGNVWGLASQSRYGGDVLAHLWVSRDLREHDIEHLARGSIVQK